MPEFVMLNIKPEAAPQNMNLKGTGGSEKTWGEFFDVFSGTFSVFKSNTTEY